MTTPATPHQPRHIRICDPGDLFAAVPALLGFHPQRSLVLLCMEDGTTLGPMMRHDIVLGRDSRFSAEPGDVAEEMRTVIASMASFCAREGFETAVALIVDDRAVGSSRLRYGREFRNLVEDLGDALDCVGSDLVSAFVMSEITDGEPWSSMYAAEHHGFLSDPRASKVALARVLEGRPIRQSRRELEETVAPVDDAFRSAVSSAFDAVRRQPTPDERTSLELVLSRVAAFDDEPLEAREVAELGAALSRVLVRDSVLALSIGDHADSAEQLWSELTRSLPAPERAIAATLLGFSAYARGDGALASIALLSALDADPTYSLALLLDESLNTGASPQLIREVAESGYRCARLCGVELVPPTGTSPMDVSEQRYDF